MEIYGPALSQGNKRISFGPSKAKAAAMLRLSRHVGRSLTALGCAAAVVRPTQGQVISPPGLGFITRCRLDDNRGDVLVCVVEVRQSQVTLCLLTPQGMHVVVVSARALLPISGFIVPHAPDGKVTKRRWQVGRASETDAVHVEPEAWVGALSPNTNLG